ncbi:MAG: SUMF1/EgtB/PvdO family nonheme iron enzyme [Spirochaetales bacterium]|nr:SUMF1/EgtB/PvdO family nonheme iron enzyme [Spirochaetales bacterium]
MSKGKRKTRRKPPARGVPGPRKSEETQSADLSAEVRLKPLLGVSPGVYLTVLYAILVLFILFMLLFYKGIRDQGTFLEVHSFPPGAAVQVDGIYAGSTPCEILIKNGHPSIRVSKPFFQPQVLEDEFSGRIFATLFVKPKRSWDVDLKVQDPEALAANALRDFAASPQIPEVLWQTALAAYHATPETRAHLGGFLDNSKYFVTDSLQLNDLIRARAILDAGSQVLTPTSLLATVRYFIHANSDYDNIPFWLPVVLPEDKARALVQGEPFAAFLARYRDRHQAALRSAQGDRPRAGGAPLTLSGLTFRPVPEGTLLQGASQEDTLNVQIPHPVAVEPIYVSATEVPVELYARFLQENPQWGHGSLPALQEEELVSEEYLQDWSGDTPAPEQAGLPVVNVSYYAAEAFCAWFTERLPGSLSGYVARLPRESEWEWAARGGLVGRPYPSGDSPAGAVFLGPDIAGPAPVGASTPNGFGLQDMAGNVWEWCSDWYSPVRYLFTSWDPELNAAGGGRPPMGFEKVVRGGSWSNERELVRVYTRGSQPPSWCTPYLGFRVVLARADR